MGIPWEEAVVAGQLLGIKTALNEFVAYAGLANLEPGLLSEQSKLITLYALCGFANFSSVGILVAGVGAMAPEDFDEHQYVPRGLCRRPQWLHHRMTRHACAANVM